MSRTDMELAGRISEVASHFPDEWQEYQDWLRDIVSSHSVLHQRYSAWQATLIFRWRLLYFVIYIAAVIVFHRLLNRLREWFVVYGPLKDKLITVTAFITSLLSPWLPDSHPDRFIFQRTATLLAVAELTLCGVAALTGILLGFYYQPAAMGAHESLMAIAHDIPNGTLILSLHHVAGHGLIVLALVQLVVMFLGREFLPSWLTGWISGIGLTLIAIGLSWTATVLDWEQISFWRFKVELGIVASIPGVGPVLRDILSGGSGINSITIQHMYTLHSYVLAIAAMFLSITHLTALICQEQRWKPAETRFHVAKLCSESSPSGDSTSTPP